MLNHFDPDYCETITNDKAGTELCRPFCLSSKRAGIYNFGTNGILYIHLIPKWPPLMYSSVSMQIGPYGLTFKCKIQQNIHP